MPMRTLVLILLFAAPCYGGPQTPFCAPRADWRKIALLTSAQFGLDFWDMRQTRSHYLEARRNNLTFVEHNGLTNALLPHPALLYAGPAISAGAAAFVSYKLSTNRHAAVRKLRYVPQYIQISANVQGLIYSRVNWKRQ